MEEGFWPVEGKMGHTAEVQEVLFGLLLNPWSVVENYLRWEVPANLTLY